MKMVKSNSRKLFFVILFLLTTLNVFNAMAQQPYNFISSPSSSENNTTATNVNHFTGKLGLVIPIYQYSGASSALNFSVGLNYSSGGVNLDQDPSNVGTNWNLSAGGFIHRTINGLPDDLYRTTPAGDNVSGFAYTPIIDNTPCCSQYRKVGYYPNPDNKVAQDSEPDDFQFSFMGFQGSFVIPKNSMLTGVNESTVKIITKPQSNFEIAVHAKGIPQGSGIVTSITEIIITDNQGKRYFFTGVQTTRKKDARTIFDKSELISSISSAKYNHYEYDFVSDYYVTDWLLTKIEDINSKEEINLVYEDYMEISKSTTEQARYNSSTGRFFLSEYYLDDQNFSHNNKKRIRYISFANGDKVSFIYSSQARCDLITDKALQQIVIQNANSNTQIKYALNFVYYDGKTEIDFDKCSTTTMEESLSKWLFLKSVSKNTTSSSVKIASFEYILSSDKVADVNNKLSVRKNYLNQDFFGFYNGQDLICNRCYMPEPPGFRTAAGYAEIGSLKKVIYPSGGSSTFEYEGNRILDNNAVEKETFGIRVKKVTENDGISIANNISKEYKYITANGLSSGFSMPLPPFTYSNQMIAASNSNVKTYEIISTSFILPPVLIEGSPVAYNRIEEITSLGKTVNEYTGLTDYPEINNNGNGYTYPYANKQRFGDWAYGLLKKQSIIDKAGKVVKTIENTHNVFFNELTSPEYRSMKSAFQKETERMVIGQAIDNNTCATTAATHNFKYDIYNHITGRSQLSTVVEKNYLKDGTVISNKVDYEYDSNFFNLKKTISYNSVNDKIERILFYPYEYDVNSNTYKLFNRSINALPVSSISIITKVNGNKYISGFEKTTFKEMEDNSIRADRILTMKSKNLIAIPNYKTTFTPEEDYGEATAKLTTDLIYDKYDNYSNVIQSSAKEVVQSVIWDRQHQIIIAKANAPYSDIAFTSFETTEKGNWNYTGEGFYDIHAITGNKLFDLSKSNIVKLNLQTEKTYLISYWSNSGPYKINNTSNVSVTGSIVNGWVYYKHKITGVVALTIQGNGLIDELRIHPENSRMTSFTYEPLLGMTSESGIDGQIVKYNYDSYGRLTSIKNELGNISKVFCYNSKGAPAACGNEPVFRNTGAMPYALYNKNCSASGAVPNPMYYYVPAGRYISFISQEDADDQALQDASTFGQVIANNTGPCVSLPTIYVRLEKNNVNRYTDAYYTYETTDFNLRFYLDAAGTIPYVLQSTMTINTHYNSTYNMYPSYNYTYDVDWNTVIEPDVSEYLLTQEETINCTTGPNYYDYSCATVSLNLLPGTNYKIIQ